MYRALLTILGGAALLFATTGQAKDLPRKGKSVSPKRDCKKGCAKSKKKLSIKKAQTKKGVIKRKPIKRLRSRMLIRNPKIRECFDKSKGCYKKCRSDLVPHQIACKAVKGDAWKKCHMAAYRKRRICFTSCRIKRRHCRWKIMSLDTKKMDACWKSRRAGLKACHNKLKNVKKRR